MDMHSLQFMVIKTTVLSAIANMEIMDTIYGIALPRQATKDAMYGLQNTYKMKKYPYIIWLAIFKIYFLLCYLVSFGRGTVIIAGYLTFLGRTVSGQKAGIIL